MAVTTFGSGGTASVATGWVVDLGGGRVGFTTATDSGLAARLAANPEVVVMPCSMRGVVASCAPQWHGTARVVTGAAATEVRAAVARRHRLPMATADLLARLRRRSGDELSIVVDLPVTNGRNGAAGAVPVTGNEDPAPRQAPAGWHPRRHGPNPAA